MNIYPHIPTIPRHQKGVVIIVALVMLLAMTVISVSSMTSSTIEERMSANLRDRETALQAAETALRYGERLANTIPVASFTDTCDSGYCKNDITIGADQHFYKDATVWADSDKYFVYPNDIAEVPNEPKIIIEYMGQQRQDFTKPIQPTDPIIYRITALATGQSDNARVMLQSTYIEP
ncbi:MAG: PilX N-terminal domain-containing pilus assembly protein [Thioalkalispiraceae bacterium]